MSCCFCLFRLLPLLFGYFRTNRFRKHLPNKLILRGPRKPLVCNSKTLFCQHAKEFTLVESVGYYPPPDVDSVADGLDARVDELLGGVPGRKEELTPVECLGGEQRVEHVVKGEKVSCGGAEKVREEEEEGVDGRAEVEGGGGEGLSGGEPPL